MLFRVERGVGQTQELFAGAMMSCAARPSRGEADWALGYPDGGIVEFGRDGVAAMTHYEVQRSATWTTSGEAVRPRLLTRPDRHSPYREVALDADLTESLLS